MCVCVCFAGVSWWKLVFSKQLTNIQLDIQHGTKITFDKNFRLSIQNTYRSSASARSGRNGRKKYTQQCTTIRLLQQQQKDKMHLLLKFALQCLRSLIGWKLLIYGCNALFPDLLLLMLLLLPFFRIQFFGWKCNVYDRRCMWICMWSVISFCASAKTIIGTVNRLCCYCNASSPNPE